MFMKKLSYQFKWMGSFFGILLILICSQTVSAWQASQMEEPSAEKNGRTTLPARSGKLSVPLIEGPNFVCEHAVFKVKNTTNSYQWSSNQPNLLSIDKEGTVKLKKGSGGLVTIRATMLGGDNTTEYIDKTIEVGAVMNESDLVISGDSVLHETGNGNGLYTINLSAGKDEDLHHIPAVQFEWGVKYPGEDFVHSVSKSNEASVSGDLVGNTVYDYFKREGVSGRVELVGRVQTPCGWSDWSRPLPVKIVQKNSYLVYPNPAREKITIEFKDEFGPEQVEIYSESAMKMIRTIRLNDAKFPVSRHPRKIEIQVADLKPGVYFLHFKSNDQTKIVSVLLE
jgi:hypothetical protein